MGKCLLSSGIPFHIFHIGPSPFKENVNRSGKFEGLTYEYLSPSIKWPANIIIRVFYYLRGCIQLAYKLSESRSSTVVYACYQGDVINLWVLWLCRLLKIPVVQEVSEWWPGTSGGSWFNDWMYRHVMFHWSNGALPISHEVEDRIRNLAGPDYPQCRVSVLVDPKENISRSKSIDGHTNHSRPVLLWCGMVDGYKRDVLFLIDAMAEIKTPAGQNSLLRIVGPCTEKVKTELLAYVQSKNISAACIDIAGFVSDEQLWNDCKQAEVLLMPLWEDDRSATRFPTKFGQYLAAGRPIVTARVGEIRHFLTDETAIFYPAGDAIGLAGALDRLLADPVSGKRIAARAAVAVLPHVDYLSNVPRISGWFSKIYSEYRRD